MGRSRNPLSSGQCFGLARELMESDARYHVAIPSHRVNASDYYVPSGCYPTGSDVAIPSHRVNASDSPSRW